MKNQENINPINNAIAHERANDNDKKYIKYLQDKLKG